MSRLVRILQIGGFLCFVGHGAFGVMTKEAWVPYFAVVGIGRAAAYHWMPIIGWCDILVGILVLLSPRPALLWWMLLWTIWTALLRPLAGEPFSEALERAGNYGMPAAMLLAVTPAWGLRAWRARPAPRLPTPATLAAIRITLMVTCALLLVGHGVLGVTGKTGLVRNLSSVTPDHAVFLTPVLGWIEIGLAACVAFVPSVSLLVFIAAWKLCTELLFAAAGAPFWEVVERGGSYAAPLALIVTLLLLRMHSKMPVPPAGPHDQ